jgi:hypothetical protein
MSSRLSLVIFVNLDVQHRGEDKGLLDPAGVYTLKDLFGALLTGQVRVRIQNPVYVVGYRPNSPSSFVIGHTYPLVAVNPENTTPTEFKETRAQAIKLVSRIEG